MKTSNNLLQKWQNWKIKHTTSIKKTTANTTLHLFISNARNAFWQSNLYTRCRDLPLSRFIRCACDGDLKALARLPIVPQTILRHTWARISEEYAKLSASPEYEKSFALSKEIAREQSKLSTIKLCLYILSIKHSKQCVECLVKLGYTLPSGTNNPAALRKALQRIAKSAGMINLELQNKRKQYQKMLSGTRPMAKNNFTQALATLSKYMGFRINPKEITVEEYLTMQNQMNKETHIASSSKNKKIG